MVVSTLMSLASLLATEATARSASSGIPSSGSMSSDSASTTASAALFVCNDLTGGFLRRFRSSVSRRGEVEPRERRDVPHLQGVVLESVDDREDDPFPCSQDPQDLFAASTEDSFSPSEAEAVDHVARETKRYPLGHPELLPLRHQRNHSASTMRDFKRAETDPFKGDAKVNMYDLADTIVQHDV